MKSPDFTSLKQEIENLKLERKKQIIENSKFNFDQLFLEKLDSFKSIYFEQEKHSTDFITKLKISKLSDHVFFIQIPLFSVDKSEVYGFLFSKRERFSSWVEDFVHSPIDFFNLKYWKKLFSFYFNSIKALKEDQYELELSHYDYSKVILSKNGECYFSSEYLNESFKYNHFDLFKNVNIEKTIKLNLKPESEIFKNFFDFINHLHQNKEKMNAENQKALEALEAL